MRSQCTAKTLLVEIIYAADFCYLLQITEMLVTESEYGVTLRALALRKTLVGTGRIYGKETNVDEVGRKKLSTLIEAD